MALYLTAYAKMFSEKLSKSRTNVCSLIPDGTEIYQGYGKCNFRRKARVRSFRMKSIIPIPFFGVAQPRSCLGVPDKVLSSRAT